MVQPRVVWEEWLWLVCSSGRASRARMVVSDVVASKLALMLLTLSQLESFTPLSHTIQTTLYVDTYIRTYTHIHTHIAKLNYQAVPLVVLQTHGCVVRSIDII
ncbi:hypothetical protein BDW42DRAFT_168385 [Aspergillus taichungensis]|uniref:Uncharacterized protein n=1 Tax=Aspergillus taichungensis TaxID=482145 RepID=A0A2J5HW75_9EURO|nr:hypothetical protein BDW42DRAFT_168385 [Aspergillus taichungensis]